MGTINFMESNQKLAISFLWLFLILSLACTFSMFIILIRKGDERENYIVKRAGFITLIISIIFFVLNIIFKIYIEPNSRIMFESSPIIYLGLISIIFNLFYFMNKRKYR